MPAAARLWRRRNGILDVTSPLRAKGLTAFVIVS